MTTLPILCAGFLIAGSLFAQPLPLTSVYDVNISEDEFEVLAALAEKQAALKKLNEIFPVLPFGTVLNRPIGSARPAADLRPAAASGSSTVIGSLNLPFSPVDPVIVPYTDNYPAQRSNPQLVFLDGLGNTIVAVDLAALAVVSQAVVPSTTGPFGIRPATTGTANEAWVVNGALQVTVVNLATQSVVTNISTSSLPTSAVSAGIVFTPDGATAFEAIRYQSPDSSGNNGALVVFDAVNRSVVSTLPLKNGPTAILMAPDGSTAYLLSGSGQLTYYDVLSGTAGLTVSTFSPGQNTGYPGAGSSVFIHPDGTRLFWNVGVLLTAFDLNTRQATQFTSGLPTTVGRVFTLSQDGSRAYFSDPLGDVVIMDTRTGNILATSNTGQSTTIFGGPPVAP